MHLNSNICVIGNGVIGKAAALGFSQAGLTVTLLGPISQTSLLPPQPDAWDARVYALNHVARDLLSSLKVWDAMDASRIAPVDAMKVTGDGAQAGNLAFDAYGARTDALAWIVEDRNLNMALDTALKFASNVRVVDGRAVRLDISDADNAKIFLENGDVLSTSLLVGADGGQSWVRNQYDIGIDYRSYGQRAIVTNFECEKAHVGIAYQWFTATGGIIALLPLPGQRVSLVWSAPDALAETLLQGSVAELADRLSSVAEENLGRLSPLEPESVKAFPLALIRPHEIIGARMALVGDAAHVIHPLAGHGMNLGFGDVADLVKVVVEREVYRECGDMRILRRYARMRKENILLMQLATDGLERLFSTDFEPVRIARNLGLNLLDKLPVIKRSLISHALGK